MELVTVINNQGDILVAEGSVNHFNIKSDVGSLMVLNVNFHASNIRIDNTATTTPIISLRDKFHVIVTNPTSLTFSGEQGMVISPHDSLKPEDMPTQASLLLTHYLHGVFDSYERAAAAVVERALKGNSNRRSYLLG